MNLQDHRLSDIYRSNFENQNGEQTVFLCGYEQESDLTLWVMRDGNTRILS